MHDAVGAILVSCACVVAITTGAAALAWRLEPGRRTLRALTRVLGGPPDAMVIAIPRSQGAGLRLRDGALAVIRGVGDPGLTYGLDEVIGVELIFDGQVTARSFRGEPRRPLDQISPAVSRVILRMVFDDVRDPEFELELLSPLDADLRHPTDPYAAVQDARRWFARLEAVIRRAGSQPAPGR